MNTYFDKNFDGWAKMSDGWANALPCPPLATPMLGESRLACVQCPTLCSNLSMQD